MYFKAVSTFILSGCNTLSVGLSYSEVFSSLEVESSWSSCTLWVASRL